MQIALRNVACGGYDHRAAIADSAQNGRIGIVRQKVAQGHIDNVGVQRCGIFHRLQHLIPVVAAFRSGGDLDENQLDVFRQPCDPDAVITHRENLTAYLRAVSVDDFAVRQNPIACLCHRLFHRHVIAERTKPNRTVRRQKIFVIVFHAAVDHDNARTVLFRCAFCNIAHGHAVLLQPDTRIQIFFLVRRVRIRKRPFRRP